MFIALVVIEPVPLGVPLVEGLGLHLYVVVKILIVVWVISFLISPYFFLAFAFIPFIFAKIGFGLLNTVCHRNGPSNVPWLNFFIAGEGYHKNHHDNFKQVRLHKYYLGGWLAEKFFVK